MSETRKITKKSLSLLFVTITIVISMSIFIPMMYCAAAGGCGNTESDNEINDISAEQAYIMINDDINYTDLVILDVRTLSEYNSGHIQNSILIPHDQLESRLFEISLYNDTEIIVYCRTGTRSRIASNILVSNNFTKVYNMLGGITGWTGNGYSVV